MKQKTKIITLVVLVTTVIGAGLISVNSVHQQIMLGFREVMNRTLEMYTKTFKTFRAKQQKVVEAYLKSRYFVENFEKLVKLKSMGKTFEGSKEQRLVTDYIKFFARDSLNGMDEFYLLTEDMALLGSNGQFNKLKEALNKTPQMEEVFKGKVGFISLHKARGDSKQSKYDVLAFYHLMPIKRGDKVMGVLILRGGVSKSVNEVINAGWFGNSAEIYVVDNRGIMLTESRFSYDLVRTGVLEPGSSSSNNIKVVDPGYDLDREFKCSIGPEDRPFTFSVGKLVEKDSGFNFEGYRNYLGKEVIGVWQWRKVQNFGMVFEISKDEAYSEFYDIRKVIIFIMGFMFAVFAFLIFMLTTSQKKNEKELQRAYDDLAIVINERTMELRQAKSDLEEANQQLSEMATIDKLTGLDNRRSLMIKLDKEWRRSMRRNSEISVAMVDVDFFKKYNDLYGHLKGDSCLTRVAAVLSDSRFVSRPGDIVARYGGEEFAIVLSEASEKDTGFICGKILEAIRRENIPHDDTSVDGAHCVTVSIGVASEVPDRFSEPTGLFEKADHALYEAKHCGRNMVKLFSEIE